MGANLGSMNTTAIKNNQLLFSLLKAPEQVIENFNLLYINSDQLSISREKQEDKFVYKLKGKKLNNKNDLERIQALVIPPAWQQVKIAYPINGHLQAVGRDVKNRKQYRYHPLWNKIRNQTKFYKLVAFGKQLPKIRKQLELDLDQKKWSKTKVLALVVKLMDETHIRIGNEQYAKRNKTYGLATMRTRHLHLYKDKISFEFVGKKGKEHKISIRNKKLMRLVNRCEEIPGWQLFQYFDSDGSKHQIDSGMVNDYIQTITGDLFTAKDFRTWAATVVFYEKLMELGIEKEEKQQHKNILQGYDASAEALGNTRNVCRKYYVHPIITKKYEDSSLGKYFKEMESNPPKEFLTSSEQTLLKILENYVPPFLEKYME